MKHRNEEFGGATSLRMESSWEAYLDPPAPASRPGVGVGYASYSTHFSSPLRNVRYHHRVLLKFTNDHACASADVRWDESEVLGLKGDR